MRRRAAWAKNLALRIEKYLGVAVISFALGALFTAWVGRDEAWAQFWTILATLAALIPAIRSLLPQKPAQVLVREQHETGRAESVPIVRVARVRGVGPSGVSLAFANVASSPVLVSEVHVYDDQEPMPHFARGGFLIASGGEKIETIPFDVNPLEGGAIIIYFQYGPTGETHHRIFLPYEVKTFKRRKEDGSSETYDRYFFELDSQRLETGPRVEKDLIESRRFWRDNPLRIVDIRPAKPKEEPDNSS